jgi:hypothetical protein
VAIAPKANEALLKPCRDPEVPAGNTDNDFATLLLNVGQAYVNCKREKEDLATWARGLGK